MTDYAKLLGEKIQGKVQDEQTKAEAEEEEDATTTDKKNEKRNRHR